MKSTLASYLTDAVDADVVGHGVAWRTVDNLSSAAVQLFSFHSTVQLAYLTAVCEHVIDGDDLIIIGFLLI